MSEPVKTVTLDLATYGRLVEALRYTATATNWLEQARASERCALLLIDLGEVPDEGGRDE